jgi:hypothetical protein
MFALHYQDRIEFFQCTNTVMLSGVRIDSPRARHGKGKLLAVLLATLVMALLLWFFRDRLLNAAPPRPKLPQSIEEYRAALKQPDFGMFFSDFSHALPSPNAELTLANAKLHLYELLGRRYGNSGTTTNIGNLIADYSAVVRKRISFGASWLKVTNDISYDDSVPKTRHETVAQIESILRTNGGFVFHLNSTNDVLLTKEDLTALGQPILRNDH